MLSWFADFYTKAPDQVKGVILGSGFTLLSALLAASVTLLTLRLTNRASDKRLAMQLEHDRRLKDRDRLMTMRREIYGNALEALTAIIQIMSGLGDHTKTQTDVDASLAKHTPALIRMNLIASEPTVRSVSELMRVITMSVSLLSSLRKRMTWLIRDKDEMESFKEQVPDADHELEIINGKMAVAEDTLSKECLKKTRELSRLVGSVLEHIRIELELPIGAEAFYDVMTGAILSTELQEDAVRDNLQDELSRTLQWLEATLAKNKKDRQRLG